MPAPPEITALVARFRRNLKDYQSGIYNETQALLEFIDPFFEALGWDIHNKKGCAEAHKDVVHEDQVKVGGATKALDYGFRIGGTRKFFDDRHLQGDGHLGTIYGATQVTVTVKVTVT